MQIKMPKNFDHHYDHLLILSQFSLLLLNLLSPSSAAPPPIGICYGRVANNLPPLTVAVDILKANNIKNVRLFNANPATLSSFSNSGISVMIGVPNEILPTLTTSSAAVGWLQSDIFSSIPANQVRYIAVGNEVFLKDPFYTPHVVPAILSLHQALQTLNLSHSIKLSSPQAASVLSISYPPSSASFAPDLKPVLFLLLQFLRDTASPFMVNLYPYFSYLNNRPYVSVDYALFRDPNPVQDGALVYDNLFDASVDAFVSALEREGFGGVEVVVSETGWPTSGGEAASVENALAYNREVVRRAAEGVGTPKKAGEGVEVYLFDLFDENEKGGEEYERHFGIFGPDGLKAYDLGFN
ncbi:putative glucan endo-1,3-beta-D-glucosidase [Rosa chinensis]|uniref:glucan endo-1,3-beta-D-glucosidase n=2 Tax=Rosa chinensis TaxID=74649 RepID=A0A2P6R3W9_ROSCH|nr:putative glucan endo-1,3-beta-D-glucosidase [Rosa chinensis]